MGGLTKETGIAWAKISAGGKSGRNGGGEEEAKLSK
jgi:hypothetical protein